MVSVIGWSSWVTGCPFFVMVSSKRVFPTMNPEFGDGTDAGADIETVSDPPPPDTTPAGSETFTWPHCAWPPVCASTETWVGVGTGVGVDVAVLVGVAV